MDSSPILSTATSQNRSAASGGTSFVPVVFSHKLATKLDHDNYLLWKPQVISAIRGHKLQQYISDSFTPPPQYISEEDRVAGILNPAYTDWDQQDQLLYSWLLSSMTEPILTRVVNCETSARLWSVLTTYFASQTEAKIDQYTTELQNFKKGSHNLNEYLLKVRSLIDKLNSVGHKTSSKEHISAIFRGLPSPDYDTFIISVNSRAEPMEVTALEALLLAQEHRIERKNKDLDSASINLANSNFRSRNNSGQFNNNHWNPYANNRSGNNSSNNPPYRPPTPGNRGNTFNSFGSSSNPNNSGRVSGMNNNKVVCQICSRTGHYASKCYQRFNPSFPGLGSQSQGFPSAMLATAETVCDESWYPDSGATHHCTSNEENLTQKNECQTSEQVYMGNGSGLSIQNIGSEDPEGAAAGYP